MDPTIDPTITISPPLTNKAVGPNFGTGGLVSPGNAGVTVTLSNGTNSYGPFNATVVNGQWSYNFQNIAAGTGDTLTASVVGFTGVSAQNTGIKVQ